MTADVPRPPGGARAALPNALTAARAVASPGIVALAGRRPRAALALAVACGATDVLDGWLARRWGVAGERGARWDTTADAVYYPALGLATFRALPAGWRRAATVVAVPVAVVRVASLLAARHQGVSAETLHTGANRAAGVALVGGSAVVLLGGPPAALIPGAVAAVAAAADEASRVLRAPVMSRCPEGPRPPPSPAPRAPTHGGWRATRRRSRRS